MSYIKKTEKYRGYTIQIVDDEDPMNPRTEWDNLAVMCCWHRRYHLGDMEVVAKRLRPVSDNYSEPIDLLYELAGLHREDCQDEEGNDYTYEELQRSIEAQGHIISPLYLYDHSGITISMGGFSCPWDSGQVGWVYMTHDTIQENWDGDKEKAWKCMKGEVETYDQFLTGDVWGYEVLDSEGDTIHSCSGYYGEEGAKDALQEARHLIDYECKSAQEKYEKQPKYNHAEMATI